jgi:hypothetical protein
MKNFYNATVDENKGWLVKSLSFRREVHNTPVDENSSWLVKSLSFRREVTPPRAASKLELRKWVLKVIDHQRRQMIEIERGIDEAIKQEINSQCNNNGIPGLAWNPMRRIETARSLEAQRTKTFNYIKGLQILLMEIDSNNFDQVACRTKLQEELYNVPISRAA